MLELLDSEVEVMILVALIKWHGQLRWNGLTYTNTGAVDANLVENGHHVLAY